MPSGEDDLIARYFKPLASHPGALSLRDDAAFLTPPPGADLVLTTDAIVAGVHFFADDPADAVARKALRVNLSDLAAKGATPLGFLLSLALPADVGDEWLSAFARGLSDDATQYRIALLGGDTVRTPGPIAISVTALGSVAQGAMVQRQGAKPGDRVLVTGTVGDAALGLSLRKGASWILDAPQREYLLQRYLLPRPRTALADAVRTHASAAMDVSDGLAGDLAKLCRVSGVSAMVDISSAPLSSAAQAVLAADSSQIETILAGGDDYEILCTVPPSKLAAFHAAAKAAQVPVAEVGGIIAGEGAPSFVKDGKPITLRKSSFSHF